MKEEKFYEKTYFVIGTCSFHGQRCPSRDVAVAEPTATTAAAGGRDHSGRQARRQTDAASTDDSNLSDVEKIIKEAEGMSMEELSEESYRESNGKTFYGLVNSQPRKEGRAAVISSNSCSSIDSVLQNGI